MSAWEMSDTDYRLFGDLMLYGAYTETARPPFGFSYWDSETRRRRYVKPDTSIYPDCDPDWVGVTDAVRMLRHENFRSLQARYGDEAPEVDDWTYRPTGYRMTPAEALKHVACWRYQSCEHRGWDETEAARLVAALESDTISRLPGFDEAPWGWGAVDMEARRAVTPHVHDGRGWPVLGGGAS